MHVCAHTHTIIDNSHMCTNSVIYRTRAYPESHTCTHTIILVYPGCTHTHSSEITSPSLPVACTRHSSGVRGCTFGRRELAGRTLAGTDWDPSTLWPPVRMSSWRPTHFHLCSALGVWRNGLARNSRLRTKPGEKGIAGFRRGQVIWGQS